MKKDFYVNHLLDSEIYELFSLLQLYIELNGKKVKVDYAIQTPTKRIKLEGTKPYTRLFLKDFTCYISNADVQTKANINEIYRNFMSKTFEGTNYDIHAAEYDAKMAEKQAKSV